MEKETIELRNKLQTEFRHSINAHINNIARQPDKPQKKLWYQEGFKDCLDQVMYILGKEITCLRCMDRKYYRDQLALTTQEYQLIVKE